MFFPPSLLIPEMVWKITLKQVASVAGTWSCPPQPQFEAYQEEHLQMKEERKN